MSNAEEESNVRILGRGDSVHPDAILEAARNGRLKRVIVLGWKEDGSFFCPGSESIESTIYMMRNAEHELFKSMDAVEAGGAA